MNDLDGDRAREAGRPDAAREIEHAHRARAKAREDPVSAEGAPRLEGVHGPIVARRRAKAKSRNASFSAFPRSPAQFRVSFALHGVARAVGLGLVEGQRVLTGDRRAVIPLHLAVAHQAGAELAFGGAAGRRELPVEALAEGFLEGEGGVAAFAAWYSLQVPSSATMLQLAARWRAVDERRGGRRLAGLAFRRRAVVALLRAGRDGHEHQRGDGETAASFRGSSCGPRLLRAASAHSSPAPAPLFHPGRASITAGA